MHIIWTPTPSLQENAHLTHFMRWVSNHKGFNFTHYEELWQWSITDLEGFWEAVWEYFRVESTAPYTQVLASGQMPGARWFEGAMLNYGAYLYRQRTETRPAILFQSERQALTAISWAELERQAASVAAYLRAQGVQAGDRVAAYLPNIPEAIAAVWGCMAIGAVWSSCSPDFGAASVVERFQQIAPTVFIAIDGYTYGGKSFDRRAVVSDICAALPTVRTVIGIPYLDTQANFDLPVPTVHWADLPPAPEGLEAYLTPLPFNHPLWILYSSGTTGMPKAITHGHGGNLLEHLKYLHLHNDVHTGERFFWFSTTGWMMWNFTVAALLAGSTIVLYDGSPGHPDLNVLWQLAEQAKINHFGTSASFIGSCMKADLGNLGERFDLSALRTIGSTGSPLPPEAYPWVQEQVKSDIWLSSMSGGTDVCTAWVGGNPLRPVYAGEIQCRCLGCAMESWDENGQPVPIGETGEMVVTKPMPSMPIYFWNDPDGVKYRSSYFEHYPDVWRHGDWLQITARDTLVILGRSDATLNRQGVRIGTAEIYRALDALPELRDALIINLEYANGTDWMPLFVLLAPQAILDAPLEQRIRQTLRQAYSPRHVPDAIFAVPDIPYTISGKKMEMPVKKILQGKPLDKAYSPDAMRNPDAMAFFIAFAAKHQSALPQ